MKRKDESGFAMLLVFAMAAAIAIMLYAEIPRVSFESQRNKEELLIERGEQYQRAIKVFVKKMNRYPGTIEELENTQNIRFLRKRYVDPMTGKDDWRLIHVGPGGVFTDSLVYKTSDKEKKAANTNTFITEGPVVGSTLPTQQQQSPFLRRRASEGGPGAGQPPGQVPGLPQGGGDPNQAVAYPPGAFPGAPAPGQPGFGAPGMPFFPGGPPGAAGAPGQQPGSTVPVLPYLPAPGQSGSTIPTTPYLTPSAPGQPGSAGAVTTFPGAPLPGQPGFGAPGMPMNPVAAPGTNQPVPGQPGMPYPGAPVSSQAGGVSPYPYSTTPGAPGGTPFFPQQGIQPAPQSMVPGQGNDATRLIQGMLMGQRGNVPSGGTPTGQMGTQIGGGIAGVASKLEDKGIKVYNERESYNEWEFIYDLTKDTGLAGARASTSNIGTPAQQLGQGANSAVPSIGGQPSMPGSGPASPGGFGYGPPPPPPPPPQQGFPMQR